MPKFDTTKVKKALLTMSAILIIFNFVVYLFAHNMHNTVFKNYHGTSREWFDILISENPEDLSNMTGIVFGSDEIIKINNDIYITGVRGVTDYFTEIGIFSKKAFVKKEVPQYTIKIVGSENNLYNNNDFTIDSDVFLNGYSVELFVLSPNAIQNDEIIVEIYDVDSVLIETVSIYVE